MAGGKAFRFGLEMMAHVAIMGRGCPSMAGPRKGLGHILVISERN